MRILLHHSLLLLAGVLLGAGASNPAMAQATTGNTDLPIYRAILDESNRAQLVQRLLERHGRDFVIYKLSMEDLDPAVVCAIGCDETDTYTIDRKIAGTGKWMGLLFGELLYFGGIADDLEFAPLVAGIDGVVGKGGTNATQFLRLAAAEGIKDLAHSGGGLEDVDDTVSMTYAFSAQDRVMIMAPTGLHLVDGAKNDRGGEVDASKAADIFTKHAFLARVIDEDIRISMAGELYMKLEPRAGVPLERIVTDGRIDLAKIYDPKTETLDGDLIEIQVTARNDSGTFKPSGQRFAAFTWTLVKALRVNRIGFQALGDGGRSGVIEDQGHATWQAYLAANPELGGV